MVQEESKERERNSMKRKEREVVERRNIKERETHTHIHRSVMTSYRRWPIRNWWSVIYVQLVWRKENDA